jgi:hypothetical protein
MQKYEKKLGNIMFIDDRVIKKKADPDNIFGCVPESDGYKRQTEEWAYLMTSSTSSYIGGDYESFTDDATPVTDDYYTLSTNGRTITFQGTRNYAGHKFYDADGNLIWATNARSIALPDNIREIGIENIVIKTAMYDMTDAICPDKEHVGIANLQPDGNTSGEQQVYDLTGRRIHQINAPGIYVVGGRKVMVK